MTASTTERVAANTDDGINRRIARETEARLAYYRDHPEEIADRLRELENEWDVERALEANAASLALAGVAFGAMGSRVWLVLPALVTSFLLQHAVQGWCPPLPVLRRIGLRTAEEIGRAVATALQSSPLQASVDPHTAAHARSATQATPR